MTVDNELSPTYTIHEQVSLNVLYIEFNIIPDALYLFMVLQLPDLSPIMALRCHESTASGIREIAIT